MPELGQHVLPTHPMNQQDGQGPYSPLTQEAYFLKSGLGYSIPGLGHCGFPKLLCGHCSPSIAPQAHIKLLGKAGGQKVVDPGGWLIPTLQGGHFLHGQHRTWCDSHLHNK